MNRSPLRDRLKNDRATAEIVIGNDGKPRRRVKTIVKVKAALAVTLPIILALLVMIGLLVTPDGEHNMFQTFWIKLSGPAGS
jgi:hypothetical protein